MNKTTLATEEMRDAYRRDDLGSLVRGRYAAAYAKATNVVVIDPTLSKVFPNSEAVNDALRSFIAVANLTTHIAARARSAARKRAAV